MPHISLQRDAAGIAVSGDRSADFGHRLVLPGGRSDGVWASWRWDGARLLFDADRYGFYPLYACREPTRWTLATGIDELLALGAPRAVDYDALAVFLRIGFFVEDDTPFRAIRAMPPGATIDTTVAGVRVGAATSAPRAQALTRTEAVEAYVDLFRQALARRLPSGAFQMPLSGGRDSRHILLELAERRALPAACVTVEPLPPRQSDDVALARQLCARFGVRHIVLGQPHDRRRLEREKNRLTHYCSDEHAQFLVLSRQLQRETTDTYDGIAGDVLSQSSYLNPVAHATFSGNDPEAAARYVLEGYAGTVSERALAALVVPPVLKKVTRDRAVARLARAIAPHMSAPNPVASFFFWNRTRREVALAPYALMRGVRVYAPYLDGDLFDLLSGLPASLQMDRRLHTDAITRGYPQHADIPYEQQSRQARPSPGGRRLAAALFGTVAGSGRVLRAPAVLPSILASLLNGKTEGLWYTALAFYLSQLAEIADV